eukprot:398529-Rhodomonas_salina.1
MEASPPNMKEKCGRQQKNQQKSAEVSRESSRNSRKPSRISREITSADVGGEDEGGVVGRHVRVQLLPPLLRFRVWV